MSGDGRVDSIPPVSRRELVERLFGLGAGALAAALAGGASVRFTSHSPAGSGGRPGGRSANQTEVPLRDGY